MSTYENLTLQPGDMKLNQVTLSICPCKKKVCQKRENCWDKFYDTVSEEEIVNQDYFTELDKSFPPPLIDVAIDKISNFEDNWIQDLKPLYNDITAQRNFNYKSLDQLKTAGTLLSITIGETSEVECSRIVDTFKEGIGNLFALSDLPIPVLVFQAEGQVSSHPSYQDKDVGFVQKMIISDAKNLCLEVSFPLEETPKGYKVKDKKIDTSVMNILEFLNMSRSKVILLGYDVKFDIAAVTNTVRKLKGGEKFLFPTVLDVMSLWVHFGGYASDPDLRFMARTIAGCTNTEDPMHLVKVRWEKPLKHLKTWTQAFIMSTIRLKICLFLSYFVIMLPTLYPLPKDIRDTTFFKYPKHFMERVVAIIAEATYYVEFDRVRYVTMSPDRAFLAIDPTNEFDTPLIIKQWRKRNYLEQTMSGIYNLIMGFWPRDAPIIIRESYEPHPTNCKFVQLLTLPGFYLSEATPRSITGGVLNNTKQSMSSETPTLNANLQRSSSPVLVDVEIVEEEVPLPKAKKPKAKKQKKKRLVLGRSVKKIVTSSNSLRDILKELSSDKEESWNILEAFLTQHPEIIDRWLAQKVGFNEEKREDSFIFGNKSNYKQFLRLRRKIMK